MGSDIGEVLSGVDCRMLVRIELLSGIEAYLKLREEGCSVPTILISPYEHEVPEWLAGEQILIKPLDPALLAGASKRALEARRFQAVHRTGRIESRRLHCR